LPLIRGGLGWGQKFTTHLGLLDRSKISRRMQGGIAEARSKWIADRTSPELFGKIADETLFYR
ncbi:hypothetical protein, partial [Microcoleus sp. herbarium5]|uniref:hypothetical protein n=1 Tax=Microcoleus sp. herbarium5 TaxID=3055434 RepID=UPI002FD33AB1